jgi:predicted phosphodiesterase
LFVIFVCFVVKMFVMFYLALLADIHGNLPALEAVLADLSEEKVSGYLVAGDIVTGPQPNEVIGRLLDLQACMIQGNSEASMLRFHDGTIPEAWWTLRQFGFTRHSYLSLTLETYAAIAGLPEQRSVCLDGVPALRLVHGSPHRVDEMLFPEPSAWLLRQRLEEIPERTLVCGHTHQPWIFTGDGKVAINPGAVAGGLNGNPRAQYALLRWDGGSWQPELRAVAYDFDQIEKAYNQSGLLEAAGGFGRACLASFRSGQDIPLKFVNFAYQLARQNGQDGEYVPDEFWRRAEQEFEWPD